MNLLDGNGAFADRRRHALDGARPRSPAANTPGMLFLSRSTGSPGEPGLDRRGSAPVRMKPFLSRSTVPASQLCVVVVDGEDEGSGQHR